MRLPPRGVLSPGRAPGSPSLSFAAVVTGSCRRRGAPLRSRARSPRGVCAAVWRAATSVRSVTAAVNPAGSRRRGAANLTFLQLASPSFTFHSLSFPFFHPCRMSLYLRWKHFPFLKLFEEQGPRRAEQRASTPFRAPSSARPQSFVQLGNPLHPETLCL